MSELPEWTPGPGTYPASSDFVKKQKEVVVPASKDMDEHIQLQPTWD